MTESTSTSKGAPKRLLLTSAGIVAILIGLTGVMVMVRLLVADFAPLDNAPVKAFLTSFVLYHVIWVCFFLSLAVAGLSLASAAVRRKHRDLVPGITLYVLGAALFINGLFLLLFGLPAWGAVALAAGLALMYLEYRLDVL